MLSYLFSLSWFWLIFFYLFLVGIASAIVNVIPGLIRYVIVKFYGINWFACIVHSVAGLLGVIWFFIYFLNDPPVLVLGEERVFFIKGMWQISPIKTIFLLFPFIGFFMAVIYGNVFFPFYLKVASDNEFNEAKD